MKKSMLIWLIQLLTMPTLAQEGEFKKNIIALETGIWSRGLVGASYTRNFCKTDNLFLAMEASAGVGPAWYGINRYFCVNPVVNLGRNRLFLMIGLDAKYYDAHFGGGVPIIGVGFLDNPTHRSGFSFSPLIGLNYLKTDRLNLKFRISTLDIQNVSNRNRATALGFSVGYSF